MNIRLRNMGKRIFIALMLSWMLSALASPVVAQGGANPFDLVPRLETPPALSNPDSVGQGSENPFDIVAPPAGYRPEVEKLPEPSLPSAEQSERNFKRLKLFLTLSVLVLLAFLLTVLRALVNRSLHAFVNDNVMSLLYRDQEGRGILPFLVLYSLLFINGGIFLFFLIHQQGIESGLSDLQLLLACIIGLSILFLLKHFALSLLAFIFPIEKEISRYNFMVIVFGISIALFLVPVNLFMAYADQALVPMVIRVALGTIAAIYVFRYLRGLVIANNFLLFHKFHFLLYICTVEIAPALFLLKLVLNQL